MRIHSLTMTAVGPYPGTEHISFDRFADSGRFLLTGPTGAGKTTIIDAIVFALYGQVADSETSSKERIRSTHAAPTTQTVVELVFSTSAGTYRLRRSPEYQRPKKRGGGTTTEKATAHLWRLTGPDASPTEEPVSGPREVGAETARLVGLNREQFTQTVVLPQGKFAQFLRASSADRQQLLQDVFGTGIYDRVQKQVAENAREARRHSQEAQAALDASIHSLRNLLTAQADETTPTGNRLLAASPQTAPSPAHLDQVLTQALQESSTRLAHLEAQEAQAQQDRTRATHHLEQVRELASRLERRRRLLEEQAQQEAQAPRLQEREQRLAQAEAAARTTTPAQVLARAQASATASVEAATTLLDQPHPAIMEVSDSAQHGLHQLQQASSSPALAVSPHSPAPPTGEDAPAASEEPPPADKQAPLPGGEALASAVQALTAAARSTQQQAGALTALADTEAGLPQRRQELTAQAAALTQAEQSLSQAEAELADRPRQLAALRTQITAAQAAQESLPALQVTCEQAQSRHQAASLAQQLTQQLAQAQDAVTTATQAAQQAEDTAHAHRRRWIATTAGTLAADLEPSTPCPVCGSTEHPRPAPLQDNDVSRTQLEAAEARASQALQALQDAVLHHQMLQEHLATATRQADHQDQAATSAAWQAAQQELETAQQAAQPLKDLEAQATGFTQATTRLAQEAAAAKARNQAAATSLQTQQAALEADTQAVRQAQADAPSVKARSLALTQQAAAYEACAQALTRCLATAQAVAQARTDLAQALHAEGLASLQQAQALRLPPEELRTLRTQVDDARTQRQRVRLALSEPEIATLTGQEQTDLPAAQAAHEQADTQHTQAVRALERARSQHQALHDACTSVQDAAARLQEVTASQAALLRVAALTSGDNDLATPLATWVLTERFQEVLVFANQRLAEMSSGRYQLTHVDDESGSARRKDRGLGLGVIDHLGDQTVRDPKTLSGGETFYVSLSLALALADVVATESGGITMETLFIDEGFGTLDPETLDKVMAELTRLQAGGRTVGIVSHVEELRRQTADRIEVRRTATGSTLRQTAT